MNLPTNTTFDGTAFVRHSRRIRQARLCQEPRIRGGISRQRPCAWCINCADGCVTTVLAHYHKAGASNLIGETFSTQETGVIEIWEV